MASLAASVALPLWCGNFRGAPALVMEKLTITAHLAAPVVFGGGYLTLDALLAALIFERTGDVDVAHGTVPLANTNGLFHGSAAIFEPVDSRRVSFVANLRAAHALDPDLLPKNKDGKVHRKIGPKRRQDFGAVMNGYTAFDAAGIVWYAEGDGAAVARLLDGAPFIGKRRGSGFGEVRRWTVEGGDWDGVVGPFGAPLRPVPVEMFAGDRSALKVEAAWRPAYWHPGNRALCHAPEAVA